MVDRINRLSLYIFYGLLAYMPLHILLSTWIGSSFGILEPAKILKDIVLIVGFGLVLSVSITKPWFKNFLKDKLLWLIVAYAALNLLLAAIKPTDQDAEILGLVYNTRFLLFFLYGWLLTHHFDAKHLQKRAAQIVLTVGGLVVVFGVIQYLLLPDDALKHLGFSRANGVLPAFFIDDKPDLERVMSTIRDPNSLGSYLIIIGLLAVAYFVSSKAKQVRIKYGALLVGTTICIWLTFSRSAWLGFMLAVGVFIIGYAGKISPAILKYKKHLLYSGLLSLLLLVSILVVFQKSYFVQNVIFHADESTVLENPNELRVRFWKESLEEIISEPEGSGPGTAGLASIKNEKQGVELNENYYLQIASEVGLVGLALFLGILSLVARRLFSLHLNPLALALLASLTGLMFTNFLVHIWSNEAVAYTWWGLAGLVLFRVNITVVKGKA